MAALWLVFVATIAAALAVDLSVHRRHRVMPLRMAAGWTAGWAALGLGFGGVVLARLGTSSAGEYYAGYLIEWSLSVDNVFVFAVLFSYFAVPAELQHRVLFWGVVGALVFRAAFVLIGVELLERFSWTTYSLGAFVVLAGLWMLVRREGVAPRAGVLRVVRAIAPVTDDYRGDRFVVNDHGRRLATPLLLVLAVVEVTDLTFAVDSIPAVLAVTSDPFVVITSNAFAVLGLRSLYFCVAGAMRRFAYLRVGLAAVLLFVGVKLMLEPALGEVPIGISVAAIAGAIALSVGASLATPPRASRPTARGTRAPAAPEARSRPRSRTEGARR